MQGKSIRTLPPLSLYATTEGNILLPTLSSMISTFIYSTVHTTRTQICRQIIEFLNSNSLREDVLEQYDLKMAAAGNKSI